MSEEKTIDELIEELGWWWFDWLLLAIFFLPHLIVGWLDR